MRKPFGPLAGFLATAFVALFLIRMRLQRPVATRRTGRSRPRGPRCSTSTSAALT